MKRSIYVLLELQKGLHGDDEQYVAGYTHDPVVAGKWRQASSMFKRKSFVLIREFDESDATNTPELVRINL